MDVVLQCDTSTSVPIFTHACIAHTCYVLGFDSTSPARLGGGCVSHLAVNRDWYIRIVIRIVRDRMSLLKQDLFNYS